MKQLYLIHIGLLCIVSLTAYKYILKRYIHTSIRVAILKMSSVPIRVFNVITFGIIAYPNIRFASYFEEPLIRIGWTITFSLFFFTRLYMDLSPDEMTNNRIYTGKGNYEYHNILHYRWVTYGKMAFNENEVGYDMLILKMKPENWIEALFRGKDTYDVKLKIPRESREIVAKIMEDRVGACCIVRKTA